MCSLAAKAKIWLHISLCGEIVKLGTFVGDYFRIIFRLGLHSETPLVALIIWPPYWTYFCLYL